ncbi:hypothetical protein H5410_045286 [Solanum commersonii]|uniref:Retrotransposon Copia-like N-terminal domain-containing protein n=1 Tax=Solanum commersonii TaxID=4109 RepID=A0A9J5XCA8_SOLCO|nr:hypothetical protein H5410_045286 [Solanum commersonii]
MVSDLPFDPMADSHNSGNLLSLAKQSSSSTTIQLPNLSLKLNRNNYSLWKENTSDILKTFSLDFSVLGFNHPPKIITPNSIATTADSSTTQSQSRNYFSAYEEWRHSDLLILVWLRQIDCYPPLGHLTRATSSHDAWTKIESKSLYVVQYDFISFVFNGLDSSYGIFKDAFNMCSGLVTPEELFGLLLQEEERFAEELRSTTINTQFGSAPSHAMLTQCSTFLQPTYPSTQTNLLFLASPRSLIF